MKKILLFFLLFFAASVSIAQLRLPALVSDSMILQRDRPVKIWGWNLDGKEVSISFNNRIYKVKPDNNKKWLVTLDAIKAGGPYTMEISTTNDSVEIKDILFGDVWLCSGQSNMEFAMNRLVEKEADDIANSANYNIREFHVNQQYSFSVKDNVTGKWKQANPVNILRFSAAAYYMAKNLYEKYKIPIGIIHSSWGGTPAEAWTSVDGLKAFPYYVKKYNYFKDTSNFNATVKKDKEVKDSWYKKVRDNDKGFLSDGTTYANPDYDISAWKTLQVPGFWETQGIPNVYGIVWARKEIFLNKEQTMHDAILDVGMIDDEDTTYFNGIKVGSSPNKYAPRRYSVPASLLREGRNVIVVRILDRNGFGGFIKDNPYRLITGNKEVSLEGAWKYAIGDSVAPLPSEAFTAMPYQPAVLFNGMIAPLIPYTIKGIAWYQGEANSDKAAEYVKLLPALINDWRNRWRQGNLPFLIVQLANYMAVQTQPSEGGWAWIRESQLKVSQTVPNAVLAVAIDIGETNTVRPLNKKEVGRRLALAAGKTAYHENNLVYSGPVYQSMKTEGSKVILSFTNIGSGLVAKDEGLKRFAVAGNDKHFVWANARIEGNNVIVWNDSIANPVAVRYAWANNPTGCNLYNKDGLPASPFRTDDWNK